jgi:hypothetical protein
MLTGTPGPFEIAIISILIFGFGLIPLIFYLITLQSTFNEINEENRKMQPGLVWLSLIPLFGLVWQFIIVSNLADSLSAEFLNRSVNVIEKRPGYSTGLAYSILFCCSIIPVLGILTSIAGLVLWIIYWVKISQYKSLLIQSRIQ